MGDELEATIVRGTLFSHIILNFGLMIGIIIILFISISILNGEINKESEVSTLLKLAKTKK